MDNKLFCECGRKLIDNFGIKRCKEHGMKIEKFSFKRTGQRIGKYSGPSKTPYGDYQNR